MNAIYTAVLVVSTLAYSAVAWIELSMEAANEDLF
ncbi:Protein CBG25617 [Caenorhabditis briggsae]|uniref:Protein CBG25617 n=1 Tax=Caenorhabditis briggsae TaxID=6238 RepID=B6IFA2_CAEBR|nr:Protein CBG25617 [Caenorhabditis briggsae]CAR98582.1 Protein CBG25617 [Caenorhabditis briggsae]